MKRYTFDKYNFRGRLPRIKKRNPPGSQPGELSPSPGEAKQASEFHLIRFNRQDFSEVSFQDFDACAAAVNKPEMRAGSDGVLWLHVTGIADLGAIERIGETFRLHRLALEDVIDAHQRPKCESYDDHIFLVLKMIFAGDQLRSEQLSLFVGQGFVLSFQENKESVLEPVRDRLRRSVGRIRHMESGYLVYSIIDAVIDHYFPVLEVLGDQIDMVESRLLEQGHQSIPIQYIHSLKGELMLLRRTIFAHRELINTLIKGEFGQLGKVDIFLRDCHDHTVQQLELTDTYREMGIYLMDLSLNLTNIKANEVMKVLTVIASIFIPLTFIVGVYGMNFDTSLPGNMPELRTPYGYLAVMAFMAMVSAGMLMLFKKKRWI